MTAAAGSCPTCTVATLRFGTGDAPSDADEAFARASAGAAEAAAAGARRAERGGYCTLSVEEGEGAAAARGGSASRRARHSATLGRRRDRSMSGPRLGRAESMMTTIIPRDSRFLYH